MIQFGGLRSQHPGSGHYSSATQYKKQIAWLGAGCPPGTQDAHASPCRTGGIRRAAPRIPEKCASRRWEGLELGGPCDRTNRIFLFHMGRTSFFERRKCRHGDRRKLPSPHPSDENQKIDMHQSNVIALLKPSPSWAVKFSNVAHKNPMTRLNEPPLVSPTLLETLSCARQITVNTPARTYQELSPQQEGRDHGVSSLIVAQQSE